MWAFQSYSSRRVESLAILLLASHNRRFLSHIAASEARQVMDVFHYERERSKLLNEAQQVCEQRDSLVFDVGADVACDLAQLGSPHTCKGLARGAANDDIDSDSIILVEPPQSSGDSSGLN